MWRGGHHPSRDAVGAKWGSHRTGDSRAVISTHSESIRCKSGDETGASRGIEVKLPQGVHLKMPSRVVCSYLHKKVASISLILSSVIRISHFEIFENSGRDTGTSDHDLGVAPRAAGRLPLRPLLATSGNVGRRGKDCEQPGLEILCRPGYPAA